MITRYTLKLPGYIGAGHYLSSLSRRNRRQGYTFSDEPKLIFTDRIDAEAAQAEFEYRHASRNLTMRGSSRRCNSRVLIVAIR